MTAADLVHLAYRMCNFNAHDLIAAGVLVADANGDPAVGGSDWTRFDNDPMTFIIKLPKDRLDKLAVLIGRTPADQPPRTANMDEQIDPLKLPELLERLASRNYDGLHSQILLNAAERIRNLQREVEAVTKERNLAIATRFAADNPPKAD